MNSPKKGFGSRAKIAIVVALIVAGLALGFLAPSLSGGSSSGGSSVNVVASANGTTTFLATSLNSAPDANVSTGAFSLITQFPKMQLSLNYYDSSDGLLENETLSYAVLGTASLGSTQYTKVDFVTAGAGEGNEVVAWFNSTGGIGRVDVLGEKNFTGPSSYVLASSYTSAFGAVSEISDNATLLGLLNKTSEAVMSIGPTQADVVTYTLGAPTTAYSSITAEYATVSGTKVLVYLHENLKNGSQTVIQVTSLTA